MAEKNFGTFTKDGEERVAASNAAAVRLRFDGWTEKKPATKPAQTELAQRTSGNT